MLWHAVILLRILAAEANAFSEQWDDKLSVKPLTRRNSTDCCWAHVPC